MVFEEILVQPSGGSLHPGDIPRGVGMDGFVLSLLFSSQ
jgi:hypothetical protein